MKLDLTCLAKTRPAMAAALRATALVDAYGRATVTVAQWRAADVAHPEHPTVRVRLAHLDVAVARKSAGWKDRVMAAGRVDGEHLILTQSAYQSVYLDCRNPDGTLKPGSPCAEKQKRAGPR